MVRDARRRQLPGANRDQIAANRDPFAGNVMLDATTA
jgi:hypothetical protein